MSSARKSLVVFVFSYEGKPTSTRYAGFAKRLQKAGALPDSEIVTVALENLAFCFTEDGGLDVFDTVSGVRMADAAFVYLKSWESLPEEAAALALYLSHKGIPYMDTLAQGMGVSKLVSGVRMWSAGLAVPASIYVRNTNKLTTLIESETGSLVGERFIAKDIQGAKGKHNYLVSVPELRQIVADNPDVQFICQRFIPNDGDYRIGVYVDKARFIIKRRGSGDTHLNNTSMGGSAEYMPAETFSEELQTIAVTAAAAAGLQVSGVDIIVDKATQRPYILEVNQGSQIVTGAFVEENIGSFVAALNEAVSERYTRTHMKPLPLLGRRTIATLPGLGVDKIIAKVDSGAYSSTLHAENIHAEACSDGEQELIFDIVPSTKLSTADGQTKTIRTRDFTQQMVRSSNGQFESRFSIRHKITVKGKTFAATLTLSDRSQMGYPMLLGRRILRSRFLVNVELNENNEQKWDY
jgi:glutathione synthase/RimK-type ligase-like ATP-grasp enzyme